MAQDPRPLDLLPPVTGRQPAHTFAERPGHADWAAFDRLMSRKGGEPPRPGDEPPEG